MAHLILLALAAAALLDDVTSVYVFHTTDIHGYLYGHIHDSRYDGTYGDVRSYVDFTMEAHPDVTAFTFDSGDFIQGTGLSDATDPVGIDIYPNIDLFGYDHVTVGNHDVGDEGAIRWLYESEYLQNIVSSNIMWSDGHTPCDYSLPYFGQPYSIFSRDGLDVLVLGFLYYNDDQDQPACTAPIAGFFDTDEWAAAVAEFAALGKAPDVVFCLNHIASDSVDDLQPIYEGVRAEFPDSALVMLNGHSHRFREGWCEDMDFTGGVTGDTQCIYAESSCYLKILGQLEFALRTPEGSTAPPLLDVDIASFHVEVDVEDENLQDSCEHTDWPSELGADLDASIDESLTELHLTDVIGYAKTKYYEDDAVNDDNALWRLYFNSVFPSIVFAGNPPVHDGAVDTLFINSGTFRDDLYAGQIIQDDLYYILPFKNEILYVEPAVSGALFKDVYYYVNYLDEADNQNQTLDHYVIPVKYWELDNATMYTIVCTEYDATKFLNGLAAQDPDSGIEYATVAYPYSDATTLSAFNDYIQEFMNAGWQVSGDVVVEPDAAPEDYPPADSAGTFLAFFVVSTVLLLLAAIAQLAFLRRAAAPLSTTLE